ncbi:hypothetical protein AO353_00240 [Pseudomonas fluorescens]|uniref:Uncharacterized protein n=1 Tax=Pseudomonas fluorescens TaxID=294 RepID=A0A0N9W9E8_PSEFL|nr:hypothetical protein AO353_00240 [Pseudomonas fluorescens]
MSLLKLNDEGNSAPGCLFWIGGQNLGKPSELKLLLFTQPSVKTDKAAFKFGQSKPFGLG